MNIGPPHPLGAALLALPCTVLAIFLLPEGWWAAGQWAGTLGVLGGWTALFFAHRKTRDRRWRGWASANGWRHSRRPWSALHAWVGRGPGVPKSFRIRHVLQRDTRNGPLVVCDILGHTGPHPAIMWAVLLVGGPFLGLFVFVLLMKAGTWPSWVQAHVALMPVGTGRLDIRILPETDAPVTDPLDPRDIQFESRAFNERYRVEARDRRRAYDVVHPRMMEHLLDSPAGTMWALHAGQVYRVFLRPLDPRGLVQARDDMLGFTGLLPRHLLQATKPRMRVTT